MKIKTLITLFPILAASLVPLYATAGATAYATVTANIVPSPVAVTMPESIMMGQVSQNASTEHKKGITLSTLVSNNTSRFNIKSNANLTYSMAVSSTVNASNKAGKKVSIDNFRLTSNGGYITSDTEHDLHMAGVLDKGSVSKSGPYTGQVYITANFN